jgi:hypothetical protein
VLELVWQRRVRVVVVFGGGDVFLEEGAFGEGDFTVVRVVGSDDLDVVQADAGVVVGGRGGAVWDRC